MIHKVGLDDLEIMKKYRVQTRNYYVSSAVEYFTCGALAVIVGTKPPNGREVNYGVSKQELGVSNRCFVHGYLGNINGGS